MTYTDWVYVIYSFPLVKSESSHGRERQRGASATQRAAVGGRCPPESRAQTGADGRGRRPGRDRAGRARGTRRADNAGRRSGGRLHGDGALSLLPQQGGAHRRHRRRGDGDTASPQRTERRVARRGGTLGAREASDAHHPPVAGRAAVRPRSARTELPELAGGAGVTTP